MKMLIIRRFTGKWISYIILIRKKYSISVLSVFRLCSINRHTGRYGPKNTRQLEHFLRRQRDHQTNCSQPSAFRYRKRTVLYTVQSPIRAHSDSSPHHQYQCNHYPHLRRGLKTILPNKKKYRKGHGLTDIRLIFA